MNRINRSYFAAIAAAALLSSSIAFSEEHRNTKSWVAVIQTARTPKSICKAVRDHVRYKSDTGSSEEWRSGWQTWREASGDCEDFAAAVKELCDIKGFKSEIIIIYDKLTLKGHALTVGEWKGKLWLSSNGSYEQFKTVDAIKAHFAKTNSVTDDRIKIVAANKLEKHFTTLIVASGPDGKSGSEKELKGGKKEVYRDFEEFSDTKRITFIDEK